MHRLRQTNKDYILPFSTPKNRPGQSGIGFMSNTIKKNLIGFEHTSERLGREFQKYHHVF
jgi:hypothetical protein